MIFRALGTKKKIESDNWPSLTPPLPPLSDKYHFFFFVLNPSLKDLHIVEGKGDFVYTIVENNIQIYSSLCSFFVIDLSINPRSCSILVYDWYWNQNLSVFQ